MTPAFTRSALNKGIQMKEVSELFELAKKSTPGRNYDRLDSCGGGIKYQCIGNDGSLVLQCDHKNNEYGFIGPKAMEDEAFFLACKPETILAIAEVFQALQQKLTNAQEALKSAGIEADTVQAGVMELASRMNQVVAEYHQLRTYALSSLVPADHNSDDELPSFEHCDAYLNAVRAEGVEMFARKCSEKSKQAASSDMRDSWWLSGENAVDFAAQLRASNAGKDGSHE